MSSGVVSLDHIQLAMPAAREDEARSYFSGLLGFGELKKPQNLAKRGGVWFVLPDERQLHLGVEEPFAPSRKAHPAFVVEDLGSLANTLEEAGYAIGWDGELAPRRRFYSADPFGNRIEYMEPTGA